MTPFNHRKKISVPDFLSSISLVYLDLADVFLMQNYQHLIEVLSLINQLPKSDQDCDFARIKEYYLDGRAGLVRQTIMVSNIHAPELNAVFSRLENVNGRVKINAEEIQGTIHSLISSPPQLFQRLPPATLADHSETRFKHFIATIIPTLRTGPNFQSGTLVYIPSYFDYIRVRNYLTDHDYTFGSLCEYTSNRQISKMRTSFFKSETKLILYTERFHFFRRYVVRGVKNLVFYGLPSYPVFYNELVQGCDVLGEVKVIYSRFEALALERIVGSEKAEKMINGEKSCFLVA